LVSEIEQIFNEEANHYDYSAKVEQFFKVFKTQINDKIEKMKN
jgi:hypothetical protein